MRFLIYSLERIENVKYDVFVEEAGKYHKYVIGVENTNRFEIPKVESTLKDEINKEYDQELMEKIQIAVEFSRLEYEHSFRRAERFDNKVYILLTVCGFIFVLLTGAINRISEIDVFDFNDPLILAYDIVMALSIVVTILLLVVLIHSLSGKKYKRYDSYKILENDLLSDKYNLKTFAKYTIMKYEKAKDYNDQIVTKQFGRLNIAVWLLIVVVVFLLSLTVFGNTVPIKEKDQIEIEKVENGGAESAPIESEEEYVLWEYTDR